MIVTQVVQPEMKHLPRMVEIEERCYTSPWTAEEIIRAFRTRSMIGVLLEVFDEDEMVVPPDAVPCGCPHCQPERFKVRVSQGIVGYLFYRLEKNMMDVWNLSIDPEHHRKGYGTALVDYLKERLIRGRRRRIRAVVNEYDLSGQLFLQSAGFRCEEILHGYRNLKADCYLMQYHKPFVPRNRFQFGGFADAGI